MMLRQDNSLQAWSWIDQTFSWVEPTAWCLLFLKKLRRDQRAASPAEAADRIRRRRADAARSRVQRRAAGTTVGRTSTARSSGPTCRRRRSGCSRCRIAGTIRSSRRAWSFSSRTPAPNGPRQRSRSRSSASASSASTCGPVEPDLLSRLELSQAMGSTVALASSLYALAETRHGNGRICPLNRAGAPLARRRVRPAAGFLATVGAAVIAGACRRIAVRRIRLQRSCAIRRRTVCRRELFDRAGRRDHAWLPRAGRQRERPPGVPQAEHGRVRARHRHQHASARRRRRGDRVPARGRRRGRRRRGTWPSPRHRVPAGGDRPRTTSSRNTSSVRRSQSRRRARWSRSRSWFTGLRGAGAAGGSCCARTSSSRCRS